MPCVKDVWDFITAFAPADTAEDWDNVGILVDSGREADRLLVTLDITPPVVAEAKARGCGIIVSHHPVIFSPLRSLQRGGAAYLLAEAGISAVCAHTNLDAAVGGVNDVLAALLGLRGTKPFGGFGRVGSLPAALPPVEVAKLCREKLGAPVRLADANRPVLRVAVAGGSGGSLWQEALREGADALVTGDAGHHDGLDAQGAGLSLIAAGHYETEWPVVPVLAQKLAAHFAAASVEVSRENRAPYIFVN